MRYLLNGLSVDSDVVLSHGRNAPADMPVDLQVRWAGRRTVPATLADGELLQGVAGDGALLCTTTRRLDAGVLVRLHGLVEFEIAADRFDVRVWADPGCPDEMVGILTAGHLIATVLALRGETVLHASAVEIDGMAVAFVADSGGGKSTLAALACARGTRFVTDDVLRYRIEDGTARCWPGATDNRLRRDVAGLFAGPAGTTDAAPTRTTADLRTVWTPPGSVFDRCRLAAIVLPRPNREHDLLVLRALAPGPAMLELSRRPRILGWIDRGIAAQTFRDLAALVRAVPVLAAEVPWGPPFDEAVIDELLGRCQLLSSDTPPPAA